MKRYFKQTTFEEPSQLDHGKSGDIVVGDLTFDLKQCRATQKGVIETEEPKILMKSKFYAREVLEGPRRPKLELEDFREVDFRYPAKLVWCGTSLSNRYLDEQAVSRETRFQVKKVQAFTVSPENAKRRPELNVSFVLPQKITKDETILVVETGVNDVTNIYDDFDKDERVPKISSKMTELISLAAYLKKKHELEKVVLLQRLPRLDEKSELSKASNRAMTEAVIALNDPFGVIIRSLHLSGSRDSLFGSAGSRNPSGELPDGIHLRGLRGRYAFTKAAIEMLKTI